MEEEPVVDVATACRLCLMNEDAEKKMLNINQEISHVIHACSIQYFESSDFPARICSNCYSILKFIYKFHKMCENSVMFLRETCLQQQEEHIEIVTKQDVDDDLVLEEATDEPPADECAEIITNDELHEDNMTGTAEAIETIDDGIMDNEETYVYEVNENHVADEHLQATEYEEEEEVDIKADISHTEYECLESVSAEDEEALWLEEAREQTHNNSSDAMAHEDVDADDDDDDDDEPTVYILKHNNEFKQQLKSKMRKTLLRAKNEQQQQQLPIRKETTSEKLYSCEICGQAYVRMNALESHRRRHRNSKPFECEICGESFDYNFKLERHMRKHTGAKPFVCEYCDRRFVDRSTMSRHQKIHRNERAYSCTTCGKSFTYYSVLKTHIMSHTGEKPYACGICDKGFHRASDLRNHLETLQHKMDPRQPELLQNIRRKDEITLHGFT